MQMFQPSSVLSAVVVQASRKYGALRRDWLSVLSLMGRVNSTPLGAARVTLEVHIQEGSRSLAID